MSGKFTSNVRVVTEEVPINNTLSLSAWNLLNTLKYGWSALRCRSAASSRGPSSPPLRCHELPGPRVPPAGPGRHTYLL
jgi:hypothetical protein